MLVQVETRQMSTIATGRCPVLILYICLVSTADICPVSAADICPVSTADIYPVSTEDISSFARTDICLASAHNVEVSEISTVPMFNCGNVTMFNCGNVTMFKSQIGGLALNRRKWSEMGSEWSPGPENRSPGFPRPFSRLWDRSHGPNPRKYRPNSRSTHPAAATVTGAFGIAFCAGQYAFHLVLFKAAHLILETQFIPQTGNLFTFLAGFGPRDWSQRLGNGRGIHRGQFSGPGDHSGPMSDHSVNSGADRL